MRDQRFKAIHRGGLLNPSGSTMRTRLTKLFLSLRVQTCQVAQVKRR